MPWFNTALIKEAGLDPEEEPGTWDKLRDIARRATKATADDVYGMVVPTKDPEYLAALVHRLAMTAGARQDLWPRVDNSFILPLDLRPRDE